MWDRVLPLWLRSFLACYEMYCHLTMTQSEAVFTWQPGRTQPGLRFVVCLQQAGWNQARRIQQAVFLPHVWCFEKNPAKYTTSLFNPGWAAYMHFSAFFQPGLSCKRAIAFMCVAGWISNPDWNSSCKHSLGYLIIVTSATRRGVAPSSRFDHPFQNRQCHVSKWPRRSWYTHRDLHVNTHMRVHTHTHTHTHACTHTHTHTHTHTQHASFRETVAVGAWCAHMHSWALFRYDIEQQLRQNG